MDEQRNLKDAPENWISGELAGLASQNRLRSLARRESPPVAGMVQIDGRQFINFGSNDYLGIASDQRIVKAVHEAVGQLGWGAGASPSVNGRGVYHARLERELAEFEGTEKTLLFPTGFAANVGAITSVVSADDAVFSDEYNHASIIDGCKLSGAHRFVYRHSDIEHLESLLKENSQFRRRLIVTDSLFSMHGDFAPLNELQSVAQRHQCLFMVDEAHGTGVWGDQGRGVCERAGVEHVDLHVGTLSKALGSMGGFVSGSSKMIDLISNRARPYIFSTAAPEVVAVASLAALDIVRSEPARRGVLQEKTVLLRKSIDALALNTGVGASQIVPIIIGEEADAIAAAESLQQAGLYVPVIRPPSVPEGQSLLRISLSYAHTEEQIKKLVDTIATITR